MTADLYADYNGMSAVHRALDRVGDTLEHQPAVVRAQCDEALAGAGQFRGALATGLATFALSWTEAFRVFADCGHLLGEHVGRTALTLATTDQLAADAAHAVTTWDVAP